MIRTTIALTLLLATPTLAAEADTSQDAMHGWKPPRVAREGKDKQEILALLQRMEQAGKKADLQAATSLVDFPVLMATDDSKGEAQAGSWSREQWTEMMKPFYAKPMDMKVKHAPTVSILTDSLALVVDKASFAGQDGKPVTMRNAMTLVRKGGEWKIKSMVEGGWGDMMNAMGGQAQGETKEPAASGTGAADQQPNADQQSGTVDKE